VSITARRNMLTTHAAYEKAGRTIMSLIYPPSAQRIVWVGDAATTKMIMNDRHTFVKNIATVRTICLLRQAELTSCCIQYKMITFYGQNASSVVAAQ